MFKLIVVLLASQLVSVFGAVFRDGRIVGGQETSTAEHPYQIALQYNGVQICGGSILNPFYVLTAAHCVYNTYASVLSVRAGSSYKDNGGQVVNIKQIYISPNYNANTQDYDIAVLAVSKPLSAGWPIELPDREYENETAVVSGWGALSSGGASPTVLHDVSVPIISRCECQASYNGGNSAPRIVTTRMLCAGVSVGGKDSCQGDSGGPLVVGNVQVGIVSWGYGCGDARWPGVYASVYKLKDFITSIVPELLED